MGYGILDDLTTFLESPASLTRATDLFVDLMPDAPDQVVVLTETGGPPVIRNFGTTVMEIRMMQVRTRGASYSDAHALAETVHSALVGISEQDIGANHYHDVVGAQSAPYRLMSDEQDRVHFVCNYQVWVAP